MSSLREGMRSYKEMDRSDHGWRERTRQAEWVTGEDGKIGAH